MLQAPCFECPSFDPCLQERDGSDWVAATSAIVSCPGNVHLGSSGHKPLLDKWCLQAVGLVSIIPTARADKSLDHQLNDTLTILSASNNAQLQKCFSGPDLGMQKFHAGKYFTVEEQPVCDLQSLAATIGSLEHTPSKTVIRGTLKDTQSGEITRTKDNFVEVSRRWCMIDIDSLPWDGDINDHRATLEYATTQLPVEFQKADCWYHFSSSMAIKSGINVHLWYWLERPCSDDEMKAWLSGCPVDIRMFNPIQIHLTANPSFVDGASDPYPDRSGLFEAGHGVTSVPIPDDLQGRTANLTAMTKPRSRSKSGSLDPAEVVRDPVSGLAIDGREQLMFQLSIEVMQTLVTEKSGPNEDEVTNALWSRFSEEVDISVVSERGAWTIADARVKAMARLQELEDGTYSFVSRSDRTTLVAGSTKAKRPKLISPEDAQAQLGIILGQFFGKLAADEVPRSAIRLTMGTGKTKGTIEHLKTFLSSNQSQTIEVYVPRHDLADEWEQGLNNINAKVVHVYPRTGGKWDDNSKTYSHPVMCQRADYVRDLETNGHSIYGNACLSRASGEQCSFFNECVYLDQFRESGDFVGLENTVRIYTHASLFLNRNEYEREATPDLVIIDEAFMSSAVSNMPSIQAGDIVNHVRFEANPQLGFHLVECLAAHHGDLSYLRDKDIGSFEFDAVSLDGLNPATAFNAETTQSRNVRSARRYKNLSKLIELAAQELDDQGKTHFEQLVYNAAKNEIVICAHKPIRIAGATPVLYLDATADPIITEPYLPALQYHQIDVRQRAVVSQVYDRAGSNSFWNEKIDLEKINLTSPDYDHHHNDLASLIVILNEWVKAGESPLLVGHKTLCDFVRDHPKLDKVVAVAHFMSLRGSNAYEDKSVIFITGRNQPPLEDIGRQARAIFGHAGHSLKHDDLENMPTDQQDYWLSGRSSHEPSAMNIPAFSDPRIAAVLKQIREAETVQAIARLRLVWASYQKRVFLLSNLPVEMPVDHLIGYNDLMPDKLEMELIKQGDIPLTPLGLEKMWPELGLNKEATKKTLQRSKASDPKRLLSSFPALVQTSVMIATFKSGNKRKTTHQHLFLPKNYTGSPTSSAFKLWTEAEVLAHLEAGWGDGSIADLEVGFLYVPKPAVSG